MNNEQFKLDYQSGMPITELMEKYSIKSPGSLYYKIKKLGIGNRGKTKHYENPFLKDSEERDYWLGGIFSDGCIVNDNTHKYVYLACLDYDILVKFQQFCGERAKMNRFTYITPVSREERIMHKVVINSAELVEYFREKHNISGKKSNTLNPSIEINGNLLRGAYDGDGSFKKGVVITSCSKEWIDKIAEFYDKHNLHYTITKDSAYRLAIYKKVDIRKVYHYLYDSASVYLKRKRDDLSRLAGEQSPEK